MKKNIVKMTLDIVMIIILALLYNSHVAAMSFHEIAGLAIFGLFIIHCLLNIKWIAGVSKRFFSKSLALKVRIGYIVNLLLLVTFIFAVISGIQTSQVLFPADSHESVWRSVHHFCGAVSIILVGIHLGLHWSFITGMVKKVVRIKSPAIRKVIAMILLVVMLSFGVYSISTSAFANWLLEPFVTQIKTESPTNRIGRDESKDTQTESPTNRIDSDESKDTQTESPTNRIGRDEIKDTQTDNAARTEKSEDRKVGGDMNDHTEKKGENKSRSSAETENDLGNNGTETKHDNRTKTVETSPTIMFYTITKFISIMGVFAALTYYIEKIFRRKKRGEQDKNES